MTPVDIAASLLGTTSKSTSSSSANGVLFIFIIVGLGFYFFIYRPQQRKAKALREQGRAFDVGDEVLTAGGLVGIVTDIDDDRVTLETAEGASFVVLRQYILRKLEEPVPSEGGGDEEVDHDLDVDHDPDVEDEDDTAIEDEPEDGFDEFEVDGTPERAGNGASTNGANGTDGGHTPKAGRAGRGRRRGGRAAEEVDEEGGSSPSTGS